jgi:hypothetical protein
MDEYREINDMTHSELKMHNKIEVLDVDIGHKSPYIVQESPVK